MFNLLFFPMSTSWIQSRLLRLRHFVPHSVKRWFKDTLSIYDLEWILRNAKQNGFSPTTVIDVGAFKGEWTRQILRLFPDVQVLMVEPQRELAPRLEQMARSSNRVTFQQALLSSSSNPVHFQVRGSVSSIIGQTVTTEAEANGNHGAPSEDDTPQNTNIVEIHPQRLDELVEETPFSAPDFLKLDVQGHELKVLRGASTLLSEHPPDLILLEVALIDCAGGAPLLADVVHFMDERGYRSYDVCTFYRRPLDDALWQMDVLFAHVESPLLESSSYR